MLENFDKDDSKIVDMLLNQRKREELDLGFDKATESLVITQGVQLQQQKDGKLEVVGGEPITGRSMTRSQLSQLQESQH